MASQTEPYPGDAVSLGIGNPADAAVYAKTSTASDTSYLKAIIDTLIAKQSTATSNGTTSTLIDSARGGAGEPDNYWNGSTVCFLTGANKGEERLVTGFVSATGTFTFGGSKGPLAFATSTGDSYFIATAVGADMLAPAVDSAATALVADSVGNKGETLVTSEPAGAADTKSVLGWLKGIVSLARFIASKALSAPTADSLADQVFVGAGTPLRLAIVGASGAATSAGSTSVLNDANRTEGNGFWNGHQLRMETGANAGQSRPIITSTSGVSVTVGSPFANAIGNGDKYVITASNESISPADTANNVTTRDVLGNRGDASVSGFSAGTNGSVIALLKGAQSRMAVATADATTNNNASDAVGNKTDTAATVVATTKSIMAYVKAVFANLGVWTKDVYATISAPTAAETDVVAQVTITRPTHVIASIDLTNLTVNATVKVYRAMGATGTTLTASDSKLWTQASDPKVVPLDFWTDGDYKITVTTGAEGANRNVLVRHSRMVSQ